jgi:alpha,alpha-trehalase
LRNNAYTNVMVAWIMGVALRAFDELLEYRRQELRESLRLDDSELSLWADMNHKMFVPFHDDGIISQFEGYEDLQELDWRHYRRKYGNVARLDRILEAEGDSPNRYKLAKQTDVVMLFYLFAAESITNIFQTLGYPLDPEAIRRNIDYYLQRTSHGSTLSSIVHSAVLARYDGEKSWRMFRRALESDVHDLQGGTTSEGIHLGVMAGTVDLVQRGYMGVEIRDEVLFFNPLVPHRLEGLGVAMRYRGVWLDANVSDGKLSILARRGGPDMVPVGVRDTIYFLKAGYRREFSL